MKSRINGVIHSNVKMNSGLVKKFWQGELEPIKFAKPTNWGKKLW